MRVCHSPASRGSAAEGDEPPTGSRRQSGAKTRRTDSPGLGSLWEPWGLCASRIGGLGTWERPDRRRACCACHSSGAASRGPLVCAAYPRDFAPPVMFSNTCLYGKLFGYVSVCHAPALVHGSESFTESSIIEPGRKRTTQIYSIFPDGEGGPAVAGHSQHGRPILARARTMGEHEDGKTR